MRGRRRGLVRWVVHVAAIDDFHSVGTLCASAGNDAGSTLATATGITCRRRRQHRVLAAGRHLPFRIGGSAVGGIGAINRNETPTKR